MDFSEIIGFIIVLLVFFLPLLRKLLIDKKRVETRPPQTHETEELEEEDIIEHTSDTSFIPRPPPAHSPKTMPKPTFQPPPSPQRLIKQDFTFQTDVEQTTWHSSIEQQKLAIHVSPMQTQQIVSDSFKTVQPKTKNSQTAIEQLIQNRHPLHAMVILSELLGKPDDVG